MKVVGIIAEYNPFHNGHKYMIDKAKEATGADYVVVVMSGDFTQRGTPAITDKYLRTEMALKNGADLVIELPVHYACSSAEYFAKGAVCLLDKLGVVDYLCFGSEAGDIERLTAVAKVLADEPEVYKQNLRLNLRRGLSYPLARNRALELTIPDFITYSDIIKTPNNILAIEYIKAIIQQESTMKPCTIRRIGSGYHDYKLKAAYSSAISIRESLQHTNSLSMIEDQVPKSCYDLLNTQYKKTYPIYLEDFAQLLHYRLISEVENGYDTYADISPELSDKIKKNIYKFDSTKNFCDLLKTKDMTHARISRCLGHILLGLKQVELDELKMYGLIHYARVLGFKEGCDALLKGIKKHSSIPFITKPADAYEHLSEIGFKQFKKDIEVAHIYEMIASVKYGHPLRNEYQRQIIIVK